MAGYALLLSAPQSYDQRAVARVIAEVTGRTVIDAMQQLYHGRGLLADHLEADQAQALGQRLATFGVAVFAVPEAELLPLSRPRAVTSGRVRAEVFEIEDQFNRVTRLPWRALTVVAAAAVETDRRELSPLERAHLETARAAVERIGEEDEGVKREYYLDLCFELDELCHYRIGGGSFSYHYLAEDGRLSLRRNENFVTLTGDIVSHAGEAWVAEGAWAVTEGRLLRTMLVRDLRLFDAEVRWRRQVLRTLGRPLAGGAPEGRGAGSGIV